MNESIGITQQFNISVKTADGIPFNFSNFASTEEEAITKTISQLREVIDIIAAKKPEKQ